MRNNTAVQPCCTLLQHVVIVNYHTLVDARKIVIMRTLCMYLFYGGRDVNMNIIAKRKHVFTNYKQTSALRLPRQQQQHRKYHAPLVISCLVSRVALVCLIYASLVATIHPFYAVPLLSYFSCIWHLSRRAQNSTLFSPDFMCARRVREPVVRHIMQVVQVFWRTECISLHTRARIAFAMI